jgi:hypothetical protein
MLLDAAPHLARPPLADFAAFIRRLLRRFTLHRLGVALALAAALLPVCHVLGRAGEARRDIVYWDEFDTALSLVLRLDAGLPTSEFFRELFAVNNEHRMATSRLMFAASYWLTGTIDFAVVNLIGNASIVVLCAMLIAVAGSAARRIRLAVLLAVLLFQLEHYENFLWSGSSIDHFQVVLLAGLAVIGVARGTRAGLAGGAVGAWMLAQRRAGRACTLWVAVGAVVTAAYFVGFHLNPAQRFVGVGAQGAAVVLHYWLCLLGAVPALGHTGAAPLLGGVLLALLVVAVRTGAVRRGPVALPLVFFAVAALGLVAVGRAAESEGVVHSRYYVLGALAWALTLALLLDRFSHPRAPLGLLLVAAPLFAAFNLAANQHFAPKADAWVECRDRAATRYKQHGVDGRGPFTLHPAPARATALLHEAERRGVYSMGPVCLRRPFPADARETSRLRYFVDEVSADARSVFAEGWVAVPGERARRGRIHFVLHSGTEFHLFSTVAITRADLAQGHPTEDWEDAGFRFVRRRDNLPTGDFQVGFLIDHGGRAEFMMTAHRLRLVGPGEALLAK